MSQENDLFPLQVLHSEAARVILQVRLLLLLLRFWFCVNTSVSSILGSLWVSFIQHLWVVLFQVTMCLG